MQRMPQSKDGRGATKPVTKKAAGGSKRDAAEPTGSPLDNGGSTESAATPEAKARTIPKDFDAEIAFAHEANEFFQMNGRPHRVDVAWRHGGPVFTLVQTVPQREVTKDELKDMLRSI